MNLQETKDVLALGISLGNATGQMLEDGSINITELAYYIPALAKIPAAISGIDKVDDELKAMTEEDKNELLDWAVAEFNIPNDKLEQYIELGLSVGLAIAKFVLTLKKEDEIPG